MREQWKKSKIGEFAEVKGGKRLPKGKQLISEPNEHPYIRIRDLGKSKYLQLNADYGYVEDETQKSIARYIVNEGDILISVVGTIGLIGIVGQTLDGANQTENCDKIINIKEVLPEYLYYYLVSNLGQEEIKRGTVGAVQPKLPLKNVQDITVLYPKLEDQEKIVKILNVIDNKINTNNKINENLLQQALAIYKAWFCDYVLSDGVLPESWHITTIDALSSLVTRGIAPKYDDNNTQIVLNQKCIRDHTIDVSLARRHLPKKINEKWISKGDLLINSTGTGTLGRVAQVWFDANNMTVDSHVTIVRPKVPILQSYIGFWGLSHESEIEAQHTGSTGQTELPRDRVKAMELILPDGDTLSKFNELVIPMADAVVSNQKENARLSQLRDTLLPKLMSGGIDVSELEL